MLKVELAGGIGMVGIKLIKLHNTNIMIASEIRSAAHIGNLVFMTSLF